MDERGEGNEISIWRITNSHEGIFKENNGSRCGSLKEVFLGIRPQALSVKCPRLWLEVGEGVIKKGLGALLHDQAEKS